MNILLIINILTIHFILYYASNKIIDKLKLVKNDREKQVITYSAIGIVMLIFGIYISYIIKYNKYVQKHWGEIFIEYFIAEMIYATYNKKLFGHKNLMWEYQHHLFTILMSVIWMYTTSYTYEFKWPFLWHAGTIIYYIQKIIKVYRPKIDKNLYYLVFIFYILQRLWRITIYIISYIDLINRPLLFIWTFIPGLIIDIWGATLGYISLKNLYKKVF